MKTLLTKRILKLPERSIEYSSMLLKELPPPYSTRIKGLGDEADTYASFPSSPSLPFLSTFEKEERKKKRKKKRKNPRPPTHPYF